MGAHQSHAYLDAVLAKDRVSRPSAGHVVTIACPCCKQPVSVPTLEMVVDHYKVTKLEAQVLRAVWQGKGHPVMADRIFDYMYADDPDGGPSPTRMYKSFKVAMCKLRKKLKGSGIDIECVGYRQGYRLILGGH